MKKIHKFLKMHKYKLFYIILLIIMLIYIIILGKLIYINNLEIQKIHADLDNKSKEKVYLISEIVRLENEKKEDIYVFDFDNDDSFQKFVTSNISFLNKSYVPKDLLIVSSKFVYDTKGGTQLLRKIANDNFQLMAEKFNSEFGEKIVVVSAYRSYNYQTGIKIRGCPDNLCAKAGYSEHQSGLAVDLWDASTNYEWKTSKKLQKYYKWLDENAHNFGFHNTYQKGVNVDGYEIEPWHWRYVGLELSIYLKENNLTIAEYYHNNK